MTMSHRTALLISVATAALIAGCSAPQSGYKAETRPANSEGGGGAGYETQAVSDGGEGERGGPADGDMGDGLFAPEKKKKETSQAKDHDSKLDKAPVHDDDANDPYARIARERQSIRDAAGRLGLGPGDDRPESVEDTHSGGDDLGVGQDSAGMPCDSTCELSEAICTSRDSICDIASANPHEMAFADDCSWAQGACDDARLLCSRCDAP